MYLAICERKKSQSRQINSRQLAGAAGVDQLAYRTTASDAQYQRAGRVVLRQRDEQQIGSAREAFTLPHGTMARR